MPLDALTYGAALSAQVEKPGARRVVRIGAAGACGGAVTVYLPGCNLRCVHCWAGPERDRPQAAPFWSYELLVDRLRRYRRENRLGAATDAIRLSGGEPILSEHFFELLRAVLRLPGTVYIETNGVLLGTQPQWCARLAELEDRVFVKLSFKGGTESQFTRITGALPNALDVTFAAAENLWRSGVPHDYNALSRASQLFSEAERQALLQRLEAIDPSLLLRLVEEEYTDYPETARRMAAQHS